MCFAHGGAHHHARTRMVVYSQRGWPPSGVCVHMVHQTTYQPHERLISRCPLFVENRCKEYRSQINLGKRKSGVEDAETIKYTAFQKKMDTSDNSCIHQYD